MYEVLLVIYLLVALALIAMVLIQQGKGADMGASFGAGASATVFGSSGGANFMTHTTAILATAFFILSLALGYINTSKAKQEAEWQNLEAPAVEQAVEVPGDVPASGSADAGSDVPN